MSTIEELEEFDLTYPWPDADGIDSLFKFIPIDLHKLERLKHIFLSKKLYCSLPTDFNDPFECRPNFKWPTNPKKSAKIRRHLIELARERGKSRKEAEKMASRSIANPKFRNKTIRDAITNTFRDLRICSLTSTYENILLWSHYTNSHAGICIEFDATVLPFSYAYRVRYSDDYPDVQYPRPTDKTALIPALTKAKYWGYEHEYRIILVPDAERQPANDGQSLHLRGNEIRAVYLGANIQSRQLKAICGIINRSAFDPRIYIANLSDSSFKLIFNEAN